MSLPRRANQLSGAHSHPQEMKSSLLSSEGYKRNLLKNAKNKKILIMGYNETGKSSIVLKFLYDIPDASSLGPEENYNTWLKYGEENFALNIVDFAGLDEYTPIIPNKHGLKVDGYILVYSVDNRRSFEFIQELRDKLKALNGRDIPTVLVANKCDLSETRQVSTEEGKKLSKALGIPYLEVSAKRHSTDVIRKVFQVMLKEVITTEEHENVLKRLRNWDEVKVHQLYSLYMFGIILLALIGVFLELFGALNLILYPTLMETQSVVLILLMVNGLVLMASSILGFVGMRRKEQDCISIFSVLVILSVLMGIASIVFKVIDSEISSGNALIAPAQISTEYENLSPLVYLIVGISFVVLVFMLVVSCLSKEIFIKKKIGVNNRYALLKV